MINLISCPECGKENPENSKYCSDCGKPIVNSKINQKEQYGEVKDTHKTAEYIGIASFILGLLLISFFFLISLGVGIYLYRLNEEQPKKRGKFLILASIGVWIAVVIIRLIVTF